MNVLPAGELSHYFVSGKIISLIDHDKVIRCSIQQDAARLVLDKVAVHLQSGNNKIFSKMLLIMYDHGVIDVKELSQEIYSKLSLEKCEDHVITSDAYMGNYICKPYSYIVNIYIYVTTYVHIFSPLYNI